MTKNALLYGSTRSRALSPLVALVLWVAPLAHAQDSPPTKASPPAAASVSLADAPSELSAYGAAWRAKGAGALKFFGFKAYDITLWLPATAAGNFSFNRPFALDITYNTNVKASDINNTSLIEMSRISAASPEQVNDWSAFMKTLFVDVKTGDRLIGVHLPAAGARFFLNGKLLGETSDVAFSEAFFKMWLDPKARKPDLRAALLGQP